MSDDLNEKIGYQVQNTAEWRREKAEPFPDDKRNLEAAKELDRLATQTRRLKARSFIGRSMKPTTASTGFRTTIHPTVGRTSERRFPQNSAQSVFTAVTAPV
jgi:hypothetical protein